MTTNELATALVNSLFDRLPGADRRAEVGLTAQDAVEAATKAYLEASDAIADIEIAKACAKALIDEVMAETGIERWSTACADVMRSAAGPSISYDSKALDALAASSDEIDRLLSPHRKISMRPGSTVIRRKVVAGAARKVPF